MNEKKITRRCAWVNMKNPLYIQYHDTEWGVPLHTDKELYELLILEGFQAGLSWECVLNKRENFRRAFDDFDVEKVSQYDEEKCRQLQSDSSIIRNKLKIAASVTNSRIFMQIQKEYGSFDNYIWGFTDRKTIDESWELRTTSPLSDKISKDLKKRGMKFVGSTIIYAYLQSIGVLNAHEEGCDCCRGLIFSLQNAIL
ncbi:MAG: DNA-3-methyladenine glycosylase I [Blautia sp.]|nr:DNA-3-methyladenine glycosylase I [Lachnoclostridium sp.]MCM1211922.1 DNA-3-methyladenine glycosylase I [Blautia sp.]